MDLSEVGAEFGSCCHSARAILIGILQNRQEMRFSAKDRLALGSYGAEVGRPQKHQCLHPKTPMPRPQKHQCLRAKTPLPAHPMGPRPSAYTREFPKLTCVGTGPRPHRVCSQWGFRAQALVFLWSRHWGFRAQALVFLWSRHWGF